MQMPTKEDIDPMSRSEKHKALQVITMACSLTGCSGCPLEVVPGEYCEAKVAMDYIVRKLTASTHDDIELFGA